MSQLVLISKSAIICGMPTAAAAVESCPEITL